MKIKRPRIKKEKIYTSKLNDDPVDSAKDFIQIGGLRIDIDPLEFLQKRDKFFKHKTNK